MEHLLTLKNKMGTSEAITRLGDLTNSRKTFTFSINHQKSQLILLVFTLHKKTAKVFTASF
jgi:hypothetical protein